MNCNVSDLGESITNQLICIFLSKTLRHFYLDKGAEYSFKEEEEVCDTEQEQNVSTYQ